MGKTYNFLPRQSVMRRIRILLLMIWLSFHISNIARFIIIQLHSFYRFYEINLRFLNVRSFLENIFLNLAKNYYIIS